MNGNWCWLLSPEGEDNNCAMPETKNDTEQELECAEDHPSDDESDNCTDDETDEQAIEKTSLNSTNAKWHEEKWIKNVPAT